MRNTSRLPTQSLQKSPKSIKIHQLFHPSSLNSFTTSIHTHFSPYFTENIQKYGTNLKCYLPKMAATPHNQTKMEALLSLALAQRSSVIGLSHNLSQSQPSISNFKQFPKSNFFQELHILPHRNRWEKNQTRQNQTNRTLSNLCSHILPLDAYRWFFTTIHYTMCGSNHLKTGHFRIIRQKLFSRRRSRIVHKNPNMLWKKKKSNYAKVAFFVFVCLPNFPEMSCIDFNISFPVVPILPIETCEIPAPRTRWSGS